jgi:hypothetical protein
MYCWYGCFSLEGLLCPLAKLCRVILPISGYNPKPYAYFPSIPKQLFVEEFVVSAYGLNCEGYLRGEANRLRSKYPFLALGLIQAACFDGTDLKAWSSRNPKDNRKGFGDPEARVGMEPEGFYLGYRSLLLIDMEGSPLGHVEASANVNEKELVEKLLDEVLGEDFEVEVAAGDSQMESRRVFQTLEKRKVKHIIPWRKKGRVNPLEVLTVKDKITVEGPEHLKVIYGRLRAQAESFMSTLKNRLGYDNYTWKGLENASIHTSLAYCVVYAASIAAMKMGRPELAKSIAYFA